MNAAATSAAAHIAPYTPFPVCDSTASLRASAAARRGAPGETQPCTSARISAPIHSWYGLSYVAVSGGRSPFARFRYAARSAVNVCRYGSRSSHRSPTCSVLKPKPCVSSRCRPRTA